MGGREGQFEQIKLLIKMHCYDSTSHACAKLSCTATTCTKMGRCNTIVCMSVCLYVCMSVCLYVCMSVCVYALLHCSKLCSHTLLS